MDFAYIGMLVVMILGFGFVIFWHELGHFLAARMVGVRVEQFAVGMGHALCSYRRGIGFRLGNTRREYEKRTDEVLQSQGAQPTGEGGDYSVYQRSQAGEKLGLGDTEYRLSWIPIGGYVKPTGQDDLRPAADVHADDPASYASKSIGRRMFIISAGVVMNIILAIILFTVLFGIGFKTAPAIVGVIHPGSPAQEAGLRIGDRIITYDGAYQHDFTKIGPSVALSEEGRAVPMLVERVDGREEMVTITPRRDGSDRAGFLEIGIRNVPLLMGVEPKRLTKEQLDMLASQPVKPGETIVEVQGKSVGAEDYHVLDDAMQAGNPVAITVEDPAGRREQRTVLPQFVPPFGSTYLNFAGMAPRTVIEEVTTGSSAKGKLVRGDIVEEITLQPANDPVPHPSLGQLTKNLDKAGQNSFQVDVTVIRDGKQMTFKDLQPNLKVAKDRKGLGIGLEPDTENPVVAEVLPDSAAARAAIPEGATITSIDGQPTRSWRDVHRVLSGATVGRDILVAVTTPTSGQARQFNMQLSERELAAVRSNRYSASLVLRDRIKPRQTRNPLIAVRWGLGETRDLMIQFYLTIKRMTQGSVAPSNAMGPVGIFHQGSIIANRGIDWVIWFLAMISANLAVVNFLPIPIVDGGLFLFLLLEKIMGRPLSPRAQGIAQIVGLVLILGVFVFVTYNDIARLF